MTAPRLEEGSDKALSVADVLERAAGLIAFNGWVRAEWQSEAGCLCAEGAIARAGACDHFLKVDRTPAGRFFASFIGGDIPTWNDAPERTQSEVVAALRQAASKAREDSGGAG